MAKIGAGFSVSLDGFVAGADDDTAQMFSWHRLEQPRQEPDPSGPTLRVIVAGRRTFAFAGGWGGKHPLDVPIVVLTHHVPTDWPNDGKPFTFVTASLDAALDTASAIAGEDGMVGVVGPDLMCQCIAAGRLDELGVNQVPVLLGSSRPQASIVDPHGHHLDDAGTKLQALARLARFAAQFGDRFDRIEALSEVNGQMRVLDLTRQDVRDAVMHDKKPVVDFYWSQLAIDYEPSHTKLALF